MHARTKEPPPDSEPPLLEGPQESIQLEEGEAMSEEEILVRWHQGTVDGLRIKTAEGSMVGFKTTYESDQRLTSWANGSNTFVIQGFSPTKVGRFPVYVALTGNYCDFDASVNLDFVRRMASQGYIGASVQYDNGKFCPDFCETESKCAYQSTTEDVKDKPMEFVENDKHKFDSASSKTYFGNVTMLEKAKGVKNALDVLCGTATADCSKGVAVSGFSQGAFLASAWSIVDSRVSALLLMSMGLLQDWEVIDHAPWHKLHSFKHACLMDSSISQHVPKTKRRYIDGSYDQYIGWYHSALQKFSGYTCENKTTPIDCIQPDGSGYYVVSPDQYTADDNKSMKEQPTNKVQGVTLHKELAGHNFFSNTRPVMNPGSLLPSFRDGKDPWCFHPSFDWLAKSAMTSGGGSADEEDEDVKDRKKEEQKIAEAFPEHRDWKKKGIKIQKSFPKSFSNGLDEKFPRIHEPSDEDDKGGDKTEKSNKKKEY